MASTPAEGRFAWERAIVGPHGPKNSSTRLVCLAIALHVPRGKAYAWPSVRTLMAETRLSNRCVLDQIEAAAAQGWIRREVKRLEGMQQPGNVYYLTIPAGVERRSPPRKVGSGERGSPVNASPVVNVVHQGGERDSSQVVNVVHRNSKEEQKKKRERRASRLPPDWTASEELRAWAERERPDLDIALLVDKFRDYYAAQPGTGGMKLDWEATFRNWVRGERQGSAQRRALAPSLATTDFGLCPCGAPATVKVGNRPRCREHILGFEAAV